MMLRLDNTNDGYTFGTSFESVFSSYFAFGLSKAQHSSFTWHRVESNRLVVDLSEFDHPNATQYITKITLKKNVNTNVTVDEAFSRARQPQLFHSRNAIR